MEAVLGTADDQEYHAPIPFDAGADLGGEPDVVTFSSQGDWIAYVTTELIGRDLQVPNALGNYELMMCLPKDVEDHWATDMLCTLAHATLQAAFNPGETCDIGETPEGSSLAGLLFLEYARLQLEARDCGLLLCIGITEPEWRLCHKKPGIFSRIPGPTKLEQLLRESGVYPVTDFYRASLV